MDEKYGTILMWDEMEENGEIQTEDGDLYQFDLSSTNLECSPETLEEDLEVVILVNEDDEVDTLSVA